MAQRVQMNLNVSPETKARVQQLARDTHRNPGQVIEWMIEEFEAEFRRRNDIQGETEKKGE